MTTGQSSVVFKIRRTIVTHNLQLLHSMSFKAVVELVLHLESYYIIQYPHQGLFSFHSSIYQLKNKHKNNAIPYQILPNLNPPNQQSTKRMIIEPRLDDEKAISSIGLAKYSDEHLTIDNWFMLRLELEAYPQLQSDEIYLQIDFRFNHKDISQPELVGESIEKVTFKLNDLQNGIFNYAQANFYAPYLSKLKFTLLGFISSFKFSKYQTDNKQPTKTEKLRAQISTTKQLFDYARNLLPKQVIQNIFYMNYVKKLRICQYLIEDRLNKLRKQSQKIQIKVCDQFKQQNKYQIISQKQFKEYLDKYIPSGITLQKIMHQINLVRQQNFNFTQLIIKEWMFNKIKQQLLQHEFEVFTKEKYGQMVFKSVIYGKEEAVKKKVSSSRQNKQIAKQMRGKNIVLNNYPIEDIKFQNEKEQQELVFYQINFPFKNKEEQESLLIVSEEEQKTRIEASKIQYSEKHMLIVLCHGYQGSFYDMALIKRWIQLELPDAYYLISRSNEGDTDGDIKKMGKNLAEQIERYITNYMEQYEQENVIINLVGHSMGGIIARAALPHLQKYKNQFGFFCSLSSPHLGYLNGVSGLIKVGLWAIKKFKYIQSLAQLSMEEKEDPRKTFLFELSKTGHLRYFRKIILLSSYQDSYVSWHSARISIHRSNNSLSKVEEEMCYNLINNNIYGASIHRIDVNFNVKTNNLDSFIGRTAHINLIIRQNLFKTLNMTVPKLFDLNEFGKEGLFL